MSIRRKMLESIKKISIPEGCISEWLFNDNVNDTSGNNNNLTNTGITFADSGLLGIPKCGVFNGSAYAITNNPPLNNNFTVCFWMKCNTTSTEAYVINNGSSQYEKAIAFALINNDTHIQYMIQKGSGALKVAAGTAIVNNNSWHFICMTYDGSTCNCYVDNQLDAAISLSGFPSSGYTTPFTVGKVYHFAGLYFKGLLTGIRAFNRTLTANEITLLYNNGNGI